MVRQAHHERTQKPRAGPPWGPLAQLVFGVSLSGWALWQLAASVDFGEVGRVILASNGLLLLLCVVSIPITMVLKAIRWRYLFLEAAKPPLQPLLSSLYIGYLMNTVLPARVGELVRAFLIGRREQVGGPAALASIVLEKVLDLSSLAITLAVLIQLIPLPEVMRAGANTFALGLTAGLALLALALIAPAAVLHLVELLERRLPVLARFGPAALTRSFLEALAVLRKSGSLPGLLFWSGLIWLGAATTMWAGVKAVGIQVGLPVILLTLVVTNVGMAVPQAPGYVGVFHYLMIETLVPFGVERDQAAAAAVVVHTVIFGNFIVGGLWFLWRGGYSLGGLRRDSKG